jgi:hypothetical protein
VVQEEAALEVLMVQVILEHHQRLVDYLLPQVELEVEQVQRIQFQAPVQV